MSALKIQSPAADLSCAEPYAASEDYELIEAAVMETVRGRWFLAEHARRARAREREQMILSVRRLERAAQDNLEMLRVHAVADDLARKLDDVLRCLKLPAQSPEPDAEEQRRIEQRLIEPRPFIQKPASDAP